MKILPITVIILVCVIQIFAQSDSIRSSIDTLPEDVSPYPFKCAILDTTPSNSRVTVDGDSIFFRLFYVDMACSEFSYNLNTDEHLLIIRRSSDDELTCDEEEQSVYGIQGHIKDVPKGKYILQLESVFSGAKGILFREAIVVD
ncbi:MAG: hypothetical protein GF401_19060 [Chitinivibrionales bacterium]|nr:hypothetical protein [Chitinivibrionales bacterium]